MPSHKYVGPGMSVENKRYCNDVKRMFIDARRQFIASEIPGYKHGLPVWSCKECLK